MSDFPNKRNGKKQELWTRNVSNIPKILLEMEILEWKKLEML